MTIVALDPVPSKRTPTEFPAGKALEIRSTTPLLKRFPRTLSFTADDYLTAFKGLRAMIALSRA
jgi:hypothetical protein